MIHPLWGGPRRLGGRPLELSMAPLGKTSEAVRVTMKSEVAGLVSCGGPRRRT